MIKSKKFSLWLLLALMLIGVNTFQVSAQEEFLVTVGQDVTFLEFNYHPEGWVTDDSNHLPLPSEIWGISEGNMATAYARAINSLEGQSGIAYSLIGLQFNWDLDGFSWEEVTNWPVNVTLNVTYTISADWELPNGAANAGVLTYNPQEWDLYIGHGLNTKGTLSDTTIIQYPMTIGGLQELNNIIAMEATAHAHLNKNGGAESVGYSEVTINSITIEFGDWCIDESDCEDALFCTGNETCVAGECVSSGDPCEAGQTCDEEANACVIPSACEVDVDCPDNGMYCDGTPVCTSGECFPGTAISCGDGQLCDEEANACVTAPACTDATDCPDNGMYCDGVPVCSEETSLCVAGTAISCGDGQLCDEEANACVTPHGGGTEIFKCTIKAGKTDGTDSIQFSGLLNATAADFTAAMGGNVIVTIEANDIPDLTVTTFTFPVDEDSFSKGKYKSPKVKPIDKSAPVTSLQIDTIKGTMKFSAKNVDLTGLSCPITIKIQIGDYAAEKVLNEDIVNGPKKPCPPELMERI